MLVTESHEAALVAGDLRHEFSSCRNWCKIDCAGMEASQIALLAERIVRAFEDNDPELPDVVVKSHYHTIRNIFTARRMVHNAGLHLMLSLYSTVHFACPLAGPVLTVALYKFQDSQPHMLRLERAITKVLGKQ